MEKDWTGNEKSAFSCIGARNYAKEEREERDWYATDPRAIPLLLSEVSFAARDGRGVCNQYVDEGKLINQNSIVRRLTPLECERLQGYEDDYTGGFSDTARYRALGNSVAVPCVEFIMQGIQEEW